MLGSLILYLKGMRIMMFQLSGFYYIYIECTHAYTYIHTHSHTNTPMYRYIRKYIHIHTYTYMNILKLVCSLSHEVVNVSHEYII